MEEEFDFEYTEDAKFSVERYEEMIRKKDLYFFDSQAFGNIIDFYIEKNDPIKALQVVEYAISQHPYAAIFLIKEAQLLLITGQSDQAFAILEKAESLEPSNADIYLIRGSIFENREWHAEALELYAKALELSDSPDEIYLQMAYVHENLEDYEKAIDCLKSSLEHDMENQDALYELAFCYDIVDKQEESISFYNQYIDKEPYSYAAWYNLGNAYTKLGMFEKALDAYDYAILIKDNFASAWFNKGNALINLERYADAINVFRHTFEYEQPDAETYCSIGECYEKLEQMDEARAFYKKAVKLDPKLAEAWFGIGITLDFEERWFESIHFYKKALAIDDLNAEYWFALGDSECKLGNFEAAKPAYEKVMELSPGDENIWLDFSSMFFEQRNYKEAIALLSEGIKHLPDLIELKYRMVAYLFGDGQISEAILNLEECLSADPDKHELLLEYLPELQQNNVITDIISRYRL